MARLIMATAQKNNIRTRFGKRVRDLRKLRGLSQEDLADRAHVHRTYMGGIERGERNPSLKNIAALADALDVTLSELFLFELSATKKSEGHFQD